MGVDDEDEDEVGDGVVVCDVDLEEIFYNIDMFDHDVFHSRRARI